MRTLFLIFLMGDIRFSSSNGLWHKIAKLRFKYELKRMEQVVESVFNVVEKKKLWKEVEKEAKELR